ncbi:MAG: T9SS type A sorting domain-containing protein [Cyclobacteriaceae bacterium]
MKRLLTTLLSILILSSTYSQTRNISGSGDWNVSGSWTGGNIGGDVDNDDDVTMSNAININIPTGLTYTIATFSVSKDGSLTIADGATLIITGDVDVAKTFTFIVNGTLTTGSMSVAKDLNMTVGSSGNFTVNGDVTVAKDAGIDIQGSATITGSFSGSTGTTINVDGSLSVGTTFNFPMDVTVTGDGPVSVPDGGCTDGGCEDSQLPITLKEFTAEPVSSGVGLSWTTLTEENFEYFEIQRAAADGEFSVIATVNGNGWSKEEISYTWADENPKLGMNYYRLESVDFDGYREQFPIVVILYEPENQQVLIGPNPVALNSNIKLHNTFGEDFSFRLLDLNGKILMEEKRNNNIISLPSNIKSGIYVTQYEVNGLKKTQKLVVR